MVGIPVPVRIHLQNENGPCSLLAILNALSIRGDTTLGGLLHARSGTPPSRPAGTSVPGSALLSALAAYLTATNAPRASDAPEVAASRAKNLEDMLALLPHLELGLDLNPVLAGAADAFEFTPAVALFDAVGLRVFHTWLPDDAPTRAAAGTLSYNEAVERVVCASTTTERARQAASLRRVGSPAPASPPAPPAPPADAFAGLLVDAEFTPPASAAPPSSPAPPAPPSPSIELLRTFLLSHPGGMTASGLQGLCAAMREGEVGVLLRGAHFCTVSKMGGVVYALVTDVGYAEITAVVWERLDEGALTGGTTLCRGDLKQVPAIAGQAGKPPTSGSDSDLALAIALQAQEEQAVQPPPRLETEEEQLARALALSLSEEPGGGARPPRVASGGSGGGGGGSSGLPSVADSEPSPVPSLGPDGRPKHNRRLEKEAEVLKQLAMEREARGPRGGGVPSAPPPQPSRPPAPGKPGKKGEGKKKDCVCM